MIDNQRTKEFSQSLYKELESSALRVMDKDDLEKFCFKLLDELRDLDEDDVCQSRSEKIGRDDAPPEYFKERIVSLEDGRAVWLGLRFFALNPDMPFVEVHKSWQGLNQGDLESIRKKIEEEYPKLKMKGIALYTPLDIVRTHKPSLDNHDMHWVVGRIDPKRKSKLTYQNQKDIKVFEDFKKSYAEFYEDNPSFKGFLGEVDEEDIKESLDSGHLYKLFLNGEFMGILAGYEDIFADQKAFYVNDVVVFRKFRGQGLAVEIQNAIHEIATLHDMKYVYGTILENNAPSLKTATRSGRKIIFGKYLIPFNQ